MVGSCSEKGLQLSDALFSESWEAGSLPMSFRLQHTPACRFVGDAGHSSLIDEA